MTATERSDALQAFRTARAAGLPPPPTRLAPAPPPGPEATAPEPSSKASSQRRDDFTLTELVQDPTSTCRRMASLREDMPARPLNVDLTPETATDFNDRCRELRVKKKDVIEVLLRAWLQASSTNPR